LTPIANPTVETGTPAPTIAAQISSGRKSTEGVFAVLKHNGTADPTTLANPNADGIVIRTYWSTVEPSPNQFDWSFIDGQIAAASSHGKRVVLVVLPGAFTPKWALADVQTATFDAKYGFTRGQPLVLPLPWDPTYLSRWFACVRAIGQRYDANPAVVLVPATGPTSVSAEMSLPNQADAVDQWRTLGYSRDKFESAWDQTLATYTKAFPTTRIGLVMYPGLPIPDATASDLTRQDLAALAVGKYGGRVAIQTSGLSARKAADPTLGYVLVKQYSTKTVVGFELGTSATAKPNRMGNSDAVVALQQSVDFGLQAGANYLEIYEKDIDNPAMQTVLHDTHVALIQSTRSGGDWHSQ
jgi:hypothetical protein